MPNKFVGGLGLRPPHYTAVLNGSPQLPSFFEVISENYMDSLGRPREVLRKVRQEYDVFVHGVSLSLASTGALDWEYLKKLKNLVDEIQPMIVSDHLCWNQHQQHHLHDLLPFPYTDVALDLIEGKIHQTQDYLGKSILLENISYYVQPTESEMSEAQFLNELCRRTGCGVLFDINNLYINSQNYETNPYQFIVEMGIQNVKQIHLAGFTQEEKFLFDTHSAAVSLPVLQIYEDCLDLIKNVPVMIEWDSDIPPYEQLEQELRRVHQSWYEHETEKSFESVESQI